MTKSQRQINNLKYGIMIPFLFLIITNVVGRQLKGKNMSKRSVVFMVLECCRETIKG